MASFQPFDCNDFLTNIQTAVTETHEEFIFDTISPFCCEVAQKIVSKRDLQEALTRYYKKGRWIRHNYENGWYSLECDQCHETSGDDSNFCPNCGADMRENKNDK